MYERCPASGNQILNPYNNPTCDVVCDIELRWRAPRLPAAEIVYNFSYIGSDRASGR